MAAARYLPLVENPYCHYPLMAQAGAGTSLLASDASGRWGWGVRVGGYVIYAKWALEMLIVLKRCQENGIGSPERERRGP